MTVLPWSHPRRANLRFEHRVCRLSCPPSVCGSLCWQPDLGVPEWQDLTLQELEARASKCWDRDAELFGRPGSRERRAPTAAVVFLHGAADSGPGSQAWLGHASSSWEAESGGDFEEVAASLGALVMFPNAPSSREGEEEGGSGGVQGRDWLDR